MLLTMMAVASHVYVGLIVYLRTVDASTGGKRDMKNNGVLSATLPELTDFEQLWPTPSYKQQSTILRISFRTCCDKKIRYTCIADYSAAAVPSAAAHTADSADPLHLGRT
jgi:hypothetical protein